jgi:transcriptional regulator with XRE-family HTH domain
MAKNLGQKLRDLREGKDLSLRECAKRLGGISAAHLSDIELGRRYPSEDLLGKLARLLGTTIEDLRQHDHRAPVEELRRLAQADPAFGLALRTLVDKQVTPEEIRRLTDDKPNRERS